NGLRSPVHPLAPSSSVAEDGLSWPSYCSYHRVIVWWGWASCEGKTRSRAPQRVRRVRRSAVEKCPIPSRTFPFSDHVMIVGRSGVSAPPDQAYTLSSFYLIPSLPDVSCTWKCSVYMSCPFECRP